MQKTEPRKLTRYEKARLIGARALQISSGAQFLVKLTQQELEAIRFNPIEIAKLEFEQDLIPMEVRPTYHHERKEKEKLTISPNVGKNLDFKEEPVEQE